MKSPFLGMDPYLEADMWIDIHHTLASYIREAIIPFIVPKYIAKIEPRTIKDKSYKEDIGIMYPDIAIFQKQETTDVREPAVAYATATTTLNPPSLRLPDLEEMEVRIPSVRIYDRSNNELITAIEIISPVNKREPQIWDYRKKRTALKESGVHLLEIDLIRRGQSPFSHPKLPRSDYRIILNRAEQVMVDIWTFNVEDAIPIVPVPLKSPDLDVHLDLGKAIHTIYERNYYHLSIDYNKVPPPPVFEEERMGWLNKQIESWKEKD